MKALLLIFTLLYFNPSFAEETLRGADYYDTSYYDDLLDEDNLDQTTLESIESFKDIKHIDHQQLKAIYNKNDPDHTARSKQYFIPLGLSNTELIAAVASASLGLLILKEDQAIMDFVQDHKNDVTHELETFGYYAGRNGIAHLVAGSYLMGLIFKNGKLKDVGILTVGSLIIGQSITDYLKFEFGRLRPRAAGGDPYQFHTETGTSFVSGHSSGAFSAATVLAHVYKDTAIPYLAYGVAGVVAYARVHEMGHYASDVFYGAIIGVLAAKLAIRIIEADDSHGGILVTPSYRYNEVTQENNFYLNIEWKPRNPVEAVNCDEFDNLSVRDRTNYCMQKAYLLSN